jgi:hypothetical protein
MDARSQRELDQLEFTAEENRYETQRQATQPSSSQQQQQSEVLRRLKELAQRQQDWNERVKELQTALQEAKTAAEREEIQRRLKRLREEEQQMLADIDALRQQMDRPENQERMADARRELDQTRSEVNRAAEALNQNSVPQALTSGVRAERQIQELRDNLRQQNSSQFADDMRQLRTAARELAQRQEDLGNQLQALNEPKRKTLTTADTRTDLADRFTQQRKQVTNLLDQATQITQQAEASEPLLAKKLYDTVRQTQQEKTDNTLDLAAELLRRSFVPQATEFEQRAHRNIEDFKRGIEGAAESVLGDETESLRQARRQIDDLLAQAEQEAAQSRSNAMNALVDSGAAGATNRTTNGPARTATAAPSPETTNRMAAASPGAGSRNAAAASGATNQSAAASAGDTNRLAAAGNQNGAGSESPRSTPSPNQARQGRRLSPTDNPASGGMPNATPRAEAQATQSGGQSGGGPITGPQYGPWSDRLRDVEEMLDQPEWRNEIARVRDRAQALRVDFKRQGKMPQLSQIQLDIINPLAEVRGRISEELARRASPDSLVPLDRDPVPNRFSELVRRYYEQLGNDK